MNRLQKFAGKAGGHNNKNCFILKRDIKKFFDSINQDNLIFLVKKRTNDPDAIWLIEKIIRSFFSLPNAGLPLGNITSQLFANIYLNELDQFIKHKLRVKYYIRYCDDFVILDGNKEYLEELIFKIDEFLKEKLKLSFHSDKGIIVKYYNGIDFLGYVSFPNYRLLRNKTKKRMFKKIKFNEEKLKQELITKESFNQFLQSYYGILKHCSGHKSKLKIDEYFKTNEC